MRLSNERKGRLLEEPTFEAIGELLFLNFGPKPIAQTGTWDDHEAYGTPVTRTYTNGFTLTQTSNWKHEGADVKLLLNGVEILTIECKNVNRRFVNGQSWYDGHVEDRLKDSDCPTAVVYSKFNPTRKLDTHDRTIIEVSFQVLEEGNMTAGSVLWAKEILIRKLLPYVEDAILTAKRQRILNEDPTLDIHYNLTLRSSLKYPVKTSLPLSVNLYVRYGLVSSDSSVNVSVVRYDFVSSSELDSPVEAMHVNSYSNSNVCDSELASLAPDDSRFIDYDYHIEADDVKVSSGLLVLLLTRRFFFPNGGHITHSGELNVERHSTRLLSGSTYH
jgi:hypothetical protein